MNESNNAPSRIKAGAGERNLDARRADSHARDLLDARIRALEAKTAEQIQRIQALEQAFQGLAEAVRRMVRSKRKPETGADIPAPENSPRPT